MAINSACGCCDGITEFTPLTIVNRPGLPALAYRVGTYTTFWETMLARLSSSEFPALAGLRTRDTNDLAIALLDAWAIVADVLTFYQERIANEGFLRTATERRSILELARLVGYSLRPGVAATVYPAFTMELGFNKDSEVPAGTRIQSVPAAGEMPHFFETSERIEARTEWNQLKPRSTRPQYIPQQSAQTSAINTLYIQGLTTNLKQNDALLLVYGVNEGQQVFRQIQEVTTQGTENRTVVTLQNLPATQPSASVSNGVLSRDGEGQSERVFSRREELHRTLIPSTRQRSPFEKLGDKIDLDGNNRSILEQLRVPPSRPPANALRLGAAIADNFSPSADFAPQILTILNPALKDTLYAAWAGTDVTPASDLKDIFAFRVKAAPFGRNAPPKAILNGQGGIDSYGEWAISPINISIRLSQTVPPPPPPPEIVVRSESSSTLVATQLPRLQALISVRRGNQTQSKLTLLQVSTTPIAVDGLPVQYTYGSSTNGLELVLTYNDGQEQREFRFIGVTGREANTVVVKIQQGDEVLLDEFIIPGQTSQYSINDHLIKVDGKQIGVLSVSDEAPNGISAELRNILPLDAKYDQITPNSWVTILRPDRSAPDIYLIQKVETVTRSDYGTPTEITQLTLNRDWLDGNERSLDLFRRTTVYAQSEVMVLLEEQIDPVKEAIADSDIELSALYKDLQPGRWLIVSGERVDLGKTTGVQASELVMLAAVIQDVSKVIINDELESDRPTDTIHTFLKLAKPLSYKYKRDTVTIYGNVVKATHGETRTETLGSGDGSQTFQAFPLRQPPLTYVADANPKGIVSTLQVRVNNILWHEADSLVALTPTDHRYTLKTDDQSNITVIFGNGEHGARLPSGVENIKAAYRSGIGKAGNVKAGQISLLATRPLGVREVINPLPATGGADRESNDQARHNTPLAILALDRLVSVQDYTDLTQAFAGIGKASAVQVSNGKRQLIHLTIAGADDIPIDPSSDLYRSLQQTLSQYGDSQLPLQINTRELLLLVIQAKVNVLADYQWELIEPQIREALLKHFSFENRQLGQSVYLSEVLQVIQSIPGVSYVDVDIFDAISEQDATDPTVLLNQLSTLTRRDRIIVNLARRSQLSSGQTIYPAQLALLSSSLPLTLVLTPI